MDTGIVRIVIDWGFSRFKLYAYDSANCLILEESHSIVDIVADPTFYDSISLEIIRGIVINFIWQFSASSAIHIFLSSQMHALAGILENGFKFIPSLPAYVSGNEIVIRVINFFDYLLQLFSKKS